VTTPDASLANEVAPLNTGASWSGPICAEGIFTGDQRKFDPGALYWENLPLPLRWAPEDFGRHDGARHVGWIEGITRDETTGLINGSGTLFDDDFIAFLQKCGGRIGVSIDPDMAEFDIIIPADAQPFDAEPEPGIPTPVLEEQQIFTKARIRAATCVDIPAFIEAQITLTPDEALNEAMVAGFSGWIEVADALFDEAVEGGRVEPTGAQREDGAVEFALDGAPVDTAAEGESAPPSAAGIVLQAADTGRLLMLQRAHNVHTGENDPNAGLWEFPGGGLEDGEDPWVAAQREFAEETGMPLPEDAENVGQWRSDDGVYQAFTCVLPNEASFDITGDQVPNPDDPDGDITEALAWWDPTHVQGACIRPEVLNMPLEDMVTTPKPPAPKAPAPPHTPPAPAPKEDPEDSALAKAVEAVKNVDTSGLPPEIVDLIKAAQAEVGEDQTEMPTEQDAMIASAAPVAPPDEWFQPFDLDGPTPLTVTADGRVFGHLATWDSCHRSSQYSGKCAKPPSDPTAPFFQMGQVITASGASVDVGVITVGGGHADKNLGLVAALEHYDDVSTGTAVVRVQEDAYGIGLFGSATPDATPEKIAALRRSPLSGDWRKEKGKWRLVAAHAVPTPGFPIPRGLVASVSPDTFITYGRPEPKQPVHDLRAVAQRLAKSAGLDTQSLVASVRQRMSDLDCGCDDEEPALVASIVGDTSLPVGEYDQKWDGGVAADNVFAHFTDSSGKVDTEGVAKAFLWRDESQPADQKSGYGLGFVDVTNGGLVIVPSGVQACAGGHGVGQLKGGATPEDIAAIKGRIGELYAKIKEKYPDAPTNPFDPPTQTGENNG